MTAVACVGFTPSRYVRRCVLCLQVRGNSAFNRESPGVCRFCRAEASQKRYTARQALRGKLTKLRRNESRLLTRIEHVRALMRAVESEIVSLDQPELMP